MITAHRAIRPAERAQTFRARHAAYCLPAGGKVPLMTCRAQAPWKPHDEFDESPRPRQPHHSHPAHARMENQTDRPAAFRHNLTHFSPGPGAGNAAEAGNKMGTTSALKRTRPLCTAHSCSGFTCGNTDVAWWRG